jgi:hypothetical protein
VFSESYELTFLLLLRLILGPKVLTKTYIFNNILILAVPGHALLRLLPVQRKRTKREVVHASNTFNVPMHVGKQ